jgi:hypothetical protein
MLINSLYGIKLSIDKDVAKKQRLKLEKAIETLGNKYRLCNPMTKEQYKNDIFISAK